MKDHTEMASGKYHSETINIYIAIHQYRRTNVGHHDPNMCKYRIFCVFSLRGKKKKKEEEEEEARLPSQGIGIEFH